MKQFLYLNIYFLHSEVVSALKVGPIFNLLARLESSHSPLHYDFQCKFLHTSYILTLQHPPLALMLTLQDRSVEQTEGIPMVQVERR